MGPGRRSPHDVPFQAAPGPGEGYPGTQGGAAPEFQQQVPDQGGAPFAEYLDDRSEVRGQDAKRDTILSALWALSSGLNIEIPWISIPSGINALTNGLTAMKAGSDQYRNAEGARMWRDRFGAGPSQNTEGLRGSPGGKSPYFSEWSHRERNKGR